MLLNHQKQTKHITKLIRTNGISSCQQRQKREEKTSTVDKSCKFQSIPTKDKEVILKLLRISHAWITRKNRMKEKIVRT